MTARSLAENGFETHSPRLVTEPGRMQRDQDSASAALACVEASR